ncbi:helix-turn-helix transcriptional regulator [Actinoplanes sp. TFC3]|uniref:helix-turn-helix transcriptional regulator n=1 Tax=Actinoplanes sp. TFC3 TaxID=1710355 RepID=UPI00191C534B|nr:helix-turn-helix transcriptional regulator [Actinoplanes sp. TFC3]
MGRQADESMATFQRHAAYRGRMSKNLALVAARVARNLTQEEAAVLAEVTKRTWQRWEDADPPRPQPAQVRRLQSSLGLPVEQLGFPPDKNRIVVEDGRGGHDLEIRFPPISTAPARPPASDYAGIWLSRYEYFSSSREETYAGQHFVVLQQDGSSASVRSLLGSASSTMSMDLAIDGVVLTGTWVEDTDKTGYYRGKRYVGGIQLVADPSGARLAGKWVGHGKDGEVNTGPWRLDYQAAATKATIAEYDRPPND